MNVSREPPSTALPRPFIEKIKGLNKYTESSIRSICLSENPTDLVVSGRECRCSDDDKIDADPSREIVSRTCVLDLCSVIS